MKRLVVSTVRGFCVSLAGAALVLSGCAQDKPPSLGERIAAVGNAHAQLADDWNAAETAKDEAEDDVRAARKAIKQAQKDLEQAQEDLADATERVAETRQRVAEIEAEAARRGIAISAGPQ
jgi:chromosome segregation ATPase